MTLIADTGRWHLLQFTGERGGRGREPLRRHGGHRRARDQLALCVVGCRRLAQADRRRVALVGEGEVAQQPGGFLDADHEDAGCHRVERAGVADPTGVREAPKPGHDIVRRPPCRLVDDDEA